MPLRYAIIVIGILTTGSIMNSRLLIIRNSVPRPDKKVVPVDGLQVTCNNSAATTRSHDMHVFVVSATYYSNVHNGYVYGEGELVSSSVKQID